MKTSVALPDCVHRSKDKIYRIHNANMESRTRNFLQKAFYIFFGPTPLLTSLLHGADTQQRDIESQIRLQQPGSGDRGSSDIWDRRFNDIDELTPSENIDHNWVPPASSQGGRHEVQAFTWPSEDEGRHSSETMRLVQDNFEGAITQGPSRLVVHDDGREALLALVINEDLVTATQEIYDETRKLEQHEKLFEDLQREISAANQLLLGAKAAWEDAEGEEAQELEQSIDQQESALQIASERRDKLSHDMDAFKFNLKFANKASHNLLRDLLEMAGLLVASPPTPEARQSQVSPAEPFTMSNFESICNSEEELSHNSARQEVYELGKALEHAQQEFDNMNISYHVAHDIYTERCELGEESMTQTEFDNRYLLSCRKITRELIEAEEALKDAKSHAVAIGALDSIDDEQLYGGWMDEWSPESEPVEEHRARQALRDWNFVEDWMADIPHSDNKFQSDTMDVDEWDAESVGIGESNSVVAEVEWYREKIDFWKRSCAQLREEVQRQIDAEMQ